jgi:hypothetical protein
LLRERGEAHSTGLEILSQASQVTDTAAQAVKPQYDRRIAFTQGLQAGLELRSRSVLTTGLLLVDFPILGLLQSVTLKVERLVIG